MMCSKSVSSTSCTIRALNKNGNGKKNKKNKKKISARYNRKDKQKKDIQIKVNISTTVSFVYKSFVSLLLCMDEAQHHNNVSFLTEKERMGKY